MHLLTGLLALLMDYNEEDECDCSDGGTCRCCLTRTALQEAAETYPAETLAAERAWGRDLERRFAPAVQLPRGTAVVGEQTAAAEA
ncbi:MAG: hypothetical protein JWM27_157 [Gemmatimonadetes bacterium]|nr:hypothetical protein [Gemmatimonadota bacterium]